MDLILKIVIIVLAKEKIRIVILSLNLGLKFIMISFLASLNKYFFVDRDKDFKLFL